VAGRRAAGSPATVFIEGGCVRRPLPGKAGGGASGGAPFSSMDMMLKGTAVAAIVTAPSLTAFGASWALFGDFVIASVAGIAVHLAGMAFAGRIYRRLFERGGAA